MQIQKIPFEAIHAFTPFFLDYIHQKESLKPFYNRFPTIENFKDQLAEKSGSFPVQHREILVASLLNQYENVDKTDAVKANLEKLKRPNTFTITTGHQLNIFTGPLYFIYKIVTVINTCKQLKQAYPQHDFVPVYWMASEDHDYDEIKSFRLYGKKYTWETKQQGAVGRFHTDDFKKLLSELPGDITFFKEAYTKHKKLSEAVRYYVNALFGSEGLIVVDGDDHSLKKLFIPAIEDDLFEQLHKPLVDQTDQALEANGYKTQIHCREINLFYLEDGLRSRIERIGEKYSVVDTNISFTEVELRELVQKYPEKFSPNVVLRPLYQEMILPNLAYVGGPAELVYWLQLKGIFDHHHIPFPMLMPRNFALIVDAPLARKFDKTGLNLEELFLPKDRLFNQAVLKTSTADLTLNGEKKAIEDYFSRIQENVTQIDKTLGPLVGAEQQRVIKGLLRIEQKVLKAEKRKHADLLRQIEAVKDSLFPNGSLQERTDNFLNFAQTDQQFIPTLIQSLDPFDFSFSILRYA
ncbi:MAG: bacillithiol biosynthesis cysteine-adding enzyme BshC [Cyclobacteriaceae bacterium]|nr:bacillithiol biosynthesis cysteine-adding enzyme BshC [Cyclobacteriaceae bacterium]